MSDLLMKLNRHPLSAKLVKALGLPNPMLLAREAGPYVARPLEGKIFFLGYSEDGYAAPALTQALTLAGAVPEGGARCDIVVMDATGCTVPAHYRALYDAFHPLLRRINPNGRIFITAANPEHAATPVAAAVARGIEGFVRTLAKETGARGITVNLAYVERDATDRLDGPVRFFCGPQTTYVTAQAVTLRSRVTPPACAPWQHALAGKVALVTGAARGIGMATAERLAQEGATVVALDISGAADELHRVCQRINSVPLMMDVAAPDAPERLVKFFLERFGGVDIVVHNAGITRDRTLAKMQDHEWDRVVNINLESIFAIDQMLLSQGVLRDAARIVCLSSVSGIAGNFGQTNYAIAKAALIGYVAAQAPLLAQRGISINAVAPGFIHTAMTAEIPFLTREIGQRFNSLKQGGLPRDVAELLTFLCTPAACGISGATIRVCGQGMIGA